MWRVGRGPDHGTPASPPSWSACAWVTTASCTRSAPARPSALRRLAASGPASTSSACRPSRTRIASPCPTSITLSSSSGRAGAGAHATATPASARQAAASRAFARRTGWGHKHHKTRSAVGTAAITGAASTGVAASGPSAIHPAAFTAACAGTAAMAAATAAIGPPASSIGDRAVAANNDAATAGATTMPVSGAQGPTCPNAAAPIGAVATVAAMPTPIGRATLRTAVGRMSAAQSVASGLRRATPATAHAGSHKPTSATHSGSRTSMPAIAAASAVRVDDRRPASAQSAASVTATAALVSEGLEPARNRNIHAPATTATTPTILRARPWGTGARVSKPRQKATMDNWTAPQPASHESPARRISSARGLALGSEPGTSPVHRPRRRRPCAPGPSVRSARVRSARAATIAPVSALVPARAVRIERVPAQPSSSMSEPDGPSEAGLDRALIVGVEPAVGAFPDPETRTRMDRPAIRYMPVVIHPLRVVTTAPSRATVPCMYGAARRSTMSRRHSATRADAPAIPVAAKAAITAMSASRLRDAREIRKAASVAVRATASDASASGAAHWRSPGRATTIASAVPSPAARASASHSAIGTDGRGDLARAALTAIPIRGP